MCLAEPRDRTGLGRTHYNSPAHRAKPLSPTFSDLDRAISRQPSNRRLSRNPSITLFTGNPPAT